MSLSSSPGRVASIGPFGGLIHALCILEDTVDWGLTPRKSKGQDALRLSPWEPNGYLKFVTVEATSMQTFFQ